MQAIRRWLLFSLLIIMIPLKGLAAAGYLGCDQLHERALPVTQAQVAVDGMPQHHVGVAGADAEGDPDELGKSLRCTQCAPCCGAVAPPAEPACLLPVVATGEVKVAVRPMELGGGVERLERPPRSALA